MAKKAKYIPQVGDIVKILAIHKESAHHGHRKDYYNRKCVIFCSNLNKPTVVEGINNYWSVDVMFTDSNEERAFFASKLQLIRRRSDETTQPKAWED